MSRPQTMKGTYESLNIKQQAENVGETLQLHVTVGAYVTAGVYVTRDLHVEHVAAWSQNNGQKADNRESDSSSSPLHLRKPNTSRAACTSSSIAVISMSSPNILLFFLT